MKNYSTKLKLVEKPKTLPKKVSVVITDNRLKEVGLCKGDEIVVDTMQAVGNGNLILIESNSEYVCGFVRFLGDGKLVLTYYNTEFESKTYKRSEIKIIGKVLYSQRCWKDFVFKGVV